MSIWALQESAKADREFAGELVRVLLEKGDPGTLEIGLEIVREAKLPVESLSTVIGIARSSIDQEDVFRHSVEVLGNQGSPTVEPVLLELHGLTQILDDRRIEVLQAMNDCAAPIFERVAWTESRSSNADIRRWGLELLARVNPQASMVPVVNALKEDPVKEVRESALEILQLANRWGPLEETALAHAVAHESDPSLRNFAWRILTAKDRRAVSSWGDPGEDAENE